MLNYIQIGDKFYSAAEGTKNLFHEIIGHDGSFRNDAYAERSGDYGEYVRGITNFLFGNSSYENANDSAAAWLGQYASNAALLSPASWCWIQRRILPYKTCS